MRGGFGWVKKLGISVNRPLGQFILLFLMTGKAWLPPEILFNCQLLQPLEASYSINKAFTKTAKKVVPRIMRELAGEGCEAVDVGIGDMWQGTCVPHNLLLFAKFSELVCCCLYCPYTFRDSVLQVCMIFFSLLLVSNCYIVCYTKYSLIKTHDIFLDPWKYCPLLIVVQASSILVIAVHLKGGQT